MAQSVERIIFDLPKGFDARKHSGALARLIAEKHGDGWEIDSIDPAARTATASRMAEVTEVTTATADSFMVRLARGTRPSDGEKVAAKLESQHEGHYVIVFEPFLGRATLTRLDEVTVRARGALAVALGVKPWDVQVSPTSDGGYDVVLPRTYIPSKHDEKLADVAQTVIGSAGWFVSTVPSKLTAHITPSDPPTFPGVIPARLRELGKLDHT